MAEYYTKFLDIIQDMFRDILETQDENIKKAGEIIAKTVMNDGIVQAFGSAHSYAAAIEICGRAGGLIQTKAIFEPSRGLYESVEGVGTLLCQKLMTDPNDCFIIISNSGRNPLPIEVAEFAKKQNLPLIAVTSLEVSRSLKSRHSSGLLLYELADVVLDNRGVYGDAAMEIPGMTEKVMSTSSFTSMALLDCSVLHAIKLMTDQGFKPLVSVSKNIGGGTEFGLKVREKYKHRLETY